MIVAERGDCAKTADTSRLKGWVVETSISENKCGRRCDIGQHIEQRGCCSGSAVFAFGSIRSCSSTNAQYDRDGSVL